LRGSEQGKVAKAIEVKEIKTKNITRNITKNIIK
jgi:hypothetical protein